MNARYFSFSKVSYCHSQYRKTLTRDDDDVSFIDRLVKKILKIHQGHVVWQKVAIEEPHISWWAIVVRRLSRETYSTRSVRRISLGISWLVYRCLVMSMCSTLQYREHWICNLISVCCKPLILRLLV